MFKRTMIATLVATATVLSAGVASAMPVTATLKNVNDAFAIKYLLTKDGANLDATITFTLAEAFSGNKAVLGVSIDNNSTGFGANRLSAFGIDTVAPTLTGVTDNSIEWAGFLGSNFSGGFQKVDLCASSGGSSCSGGANDGVVALAPNYNFALTLTTSGAFNSTDGIKFTSPYAVKFQSVGNTGRSVEFAGCLATDTSCMSAPPEQFNVPEPMSLALVGISLFGAAAATRRRKA